MSDPSTLHWYRHGGQLPERPATRTTYLLPPPIRWFNSRSEAIRTFAAVVAIFYVASEKL